MARTWWDVDRDPIVAWSRSGRSFDLVDPEEPGAHRLALLELAVPAADPRAVADVLARGLAACDFPPTGDRAAPGRVLATLRVAGTSVTPADGWADAP